MRKGKEKICVVMTGGTICSVPGANGKNQSNAAKVGTRLTDDYFYRTDSPFRDKVTFDIKFLKPDVLSENITVGVWEGILKIFQKIKYDNYKGIILLHGTDTLAYTAAFLSFALAGIPIPVCLVSAQERLGEQKDGEWIPNDRSNGYANFRAAVELMMNGIKPNVYVVYENVPRDFTKPPKERALLVHYGAHLIQCPNASEHFHSRDEMRVPDTANVKLEGKEFESKERLYCRIKKISGAVLLLTPYTNFDYRAVNLRGVKGVVHGTYHSESVCVGRPMRKYGMKSGRNDYALEEITKKDRPYSILCLLKKCKKRGIPVFLAPCNGETARYGTTANACTAGAIAVQSSMVTVESVYAKAVLGCSLGKTGKDLVEFLLQNSVNYEYE